MSHPAWVCGLKLLVDYDFPYLRSVTPCVGVWIETILPLTRRRTSEVTPCVGVWIETSIGDYFLVHIPSHPAWVCGLKLIPSGKYMTDKLSHPAWVCGLKLINIHITMSVHLSHPAWVCGLKLHRIGNPYLFLLSHPAWVCGLKHVQRDSRK